MVISKSWSRCFGRCVMDNFRKYYEAYDDRYRQIHREELRWFTQLPSPIVWEIISEFGISPSDRLLEIGCGEGRDAIFLLNQGFQVLATDISPEAVAYCHRENPQFPPIFRCWTVFVTRWKQNLILFMPLPSFICWFWMRIGTHFTASSVTALRRRELL